MHNMTSYFRSPEMNDGGPFLCPNCNKKLAVKLKGNCLVQLLCPRCHSFISIKMKEPVNWDKTKPSTVLGTSNVDLKPAS